MNGGQKSNERLLGLTRVGPFAIGIALAMASAIPGTALATGGTGCMKTANQLFQGCLSDADETLRVGNANCLNIGESHERRACFRASRAEAAEEREECGEVRAARKGVCRDLQEDIYDPDPLLVENTLPEEELAAQNPYVNLTPGFTTLVRITEEGEDTGEFVVMTVTDETEEIQGKDCRVVADVELALDEEDEEEAEGEEADAMVTADDDDGDGEVDYEVLESTYDYYALTTPNYDVIYCGETTLAFENDGLTIDTDGSFIAGIEYAKAGYLTRSAPMVHTSERQEYALDEAEDVVTYVSLASAPGEDFGGNNENAEGDYSCGEDGCLETFDFNPLDPESEESKFYLAAPDGPGFVLALAFEDGEFNGEREELVCDFPTLEEFWANAESDCGVEDIEELAEDLCEVAPEGFCDDGEED